MTDDANQPRTSGLFDLEEAELALGMLLIAFGHPMDEHTERTAARAAKAWQHSLSGYTTDPAEHLATTFPVEGQPGIIVVTGIHVQSTCAHHLLPITGTATVAYRPNPRVGRVVGLSKLSRLVEGYGRRLQVQEQLGDQVARTLQKQLQPDGAACIITAEHGCMTIRGIQQRGTVTTTVATAGDWHTGHPDVALALQEHHRD